MGKKRDFLNNNLVIAQLYVFASTNSILKPNTKKYEYFCRIDQMNILHSASFTRIVDLINAIMSKLSLIQFSP